MIHVNENTTVGVGSGSLKDLTSIQVPSLETVISNVTEVSLDIIEEIKNANEDTILDVEIEIIEPSDEELVIPTYPPTMIPTQSGVITEGPSLRPTAQPICGSDLIIGDEKDCELLHITNWTGITVKSGFCNSEYWNLTLSDYRCLEKLVVGNNSLKYLESLTISNNPRLSQIVIGDGGDNEGAFYNVTRVVIVSTFCIR